MSKPSDEYWAQFTDLKDLLHLIPEDIEIFYKTLTGNNHIEDDIDEFPGSSIFI